MGEAHLHRERKKEGRNPNRDAQSFKFGFVTNSHSLTPMASQERTL
jgi:hypothetical protein